MSIKTKARDLEVGNVILDGIASRIDSIVKHDDLAEVYIILTDGNGYQDQLRLSYDAEVVHFDDWTPEDWTAYLEMT
ncbi:hypothetical protein SEA_ZOOMAN_339 [Microbacterium phage Zooman]|nr:hypothetical protein SEA_ZOOMAN_26 [Microbacterium phage Zooman]UDL16580.1 hypothetical protein SEA_ZOOMAN_339 [Microbacterium phage Zooman]